MNQFRAVNTHVIRRAWQYKRSEQPLINPAERCFLVAPYSATCLNRGELKKNRDIVCQSKLIHQGRPNKCLLDRLTGNRF